MQTFTTDTIVAPATGPGEYGIAIIRVSGSAARAVLDRHVRRTAVADAWSPRHLYHGIFCTPNGEHLDEIMAVFFPGPHSFTGEDCAEFHCHGGRVVVRRLLDALMASGLRHAQPGEFTRRAFLNGRIDLSRAEAVADIIHARSETSRRLAMVQLEGGLFRLVGSLREQLVDLLALIEAYIDFPEDDLGKLESERIAASSDYLRNEFQRLLDSYEQGRILRDGAALLILGRPNVGKSSLLNALVGEERAIVSDIPGTTRDTIEESISLSGFPLRIIDSAGIRASCDAIETLGVQRALAKLAVADLILLVFDGSVGFTAEDAAILRHCADRPVLLVRNKADLSQNGQLQPPADYPGVQISCRSAAGLAELPLRIQELLAPEADTDLTSRALICDLRHKEALGRASRSLDSFVQLVQDKAPLELMACELHQALDALGEITGETTPDEILDRIFGRFCIGK